MTRNEWIAEAFSRDGYIVKHLPDIIKAADALEAAGVAPWKAEPAKDEGEAIGLVRRCVSLIKKIGRRDDGIFADMDAFLSRLDGKGGASHGN